MPILIIAIPVVLAGIKMKMNLKEQRSRNRMTENMRAEHEEFMKIIDDFKKIK
jgi:hypothetical protein